MSSLDRTEWDFSAVPDAELRMCCLYEYAREAERELWVRAKSDAEPRLDEAGFSAAKPALSHSRLPIPVLQDVFGGDGVHHDEYFPPKPWQEHTKGERGLVVFALQHLREGRPQAHPVQIVDPARFALRWGKTGGADGGVSVGDNGVARVCLQIDLRNNRDSDIQDELHGLLKALRFTGEAHFPGKFAEPKTRGRGDKGENYRSRLDGLALVRLRHHMDIPSLRRLVESDAPDFSRPWQKRDSDATVREKVNKIRERVAVWFREQYPELGPKAQPESYAPLPVGAE